jgi:hypothetical protein
MTTETIDRLFLELSQVTSAKTKRELELECTAKASLAFQEQAVRERDEARAELARLREGPIAVQSIGLVRNGDNLVVLAEIDGRRVVVIREPADGPISHFIEAGGIRRRAETL